MLPVVPMTKQKRLLLTVIVSALAVAGLVRSVSSGVVPSAAGGNVLYVDSFENGLTDWTILTDTPENRVAVITSPLHSGASAAALVRASTGYAALSHTLTATTNIRVREWVYDSADQSSGAFETVQSIDSPYYTALVIPPSEIYTDSYALRFGTSWLTPAGKRNLGWHAFDIITTPDGTFARVDEKVLDRAVPGNTLAIWLNTAQPQAFWIKSVSPWHPSTFVFDDVEVTAPSASVDDLLLAVKDDFLKLYGSTDFSPLYANLGGPQAIPCLPDMRSLAATSMAFALDARIGPPDRRTASRQRAIQLISDTLAYGQWAYDDINVTGLYYCNSVTTSALALSAWLIWRDIPSDLKTHVKARVVADANKYTAGYPHSGYINDSKIEENGLAATFLAIAANMFPVEANASQWEARARCFAYHTITNQPSSYCGYTTQTVWPDFKVDNHNLSPNPHYADSGLQELAGAGLAYRAAGRTVPAEFAHNVVGLWLRQKQDIDWGRTYYYLVNTDWGSQGWTWMGGSIAAFLSLEPGTYQNGTPLVSAEDELKFLQRRWLINDGRVAVYTLPVISISEQNFAPGTPSYTWFLNANQMQWGYIWGYLYHHPNLLAPTTVYSNSVFMPGIVANH